MLDLLYLSWTTDYISKKFFFFFNPESKKHPLKNKAF